MRKFSPQQDCRLLPFRSLWRCWTAARSDQLLEAARPGSDRLEHLTEAREEARSDLYGFAGRHGDGLLRRRMLAMGLNPDELALSDPALFRHLHKCCVLCERPQDCASDLWRASTAQVWSGRDDWRDYCENALVLEMLVALRTRSKSAGSDCRSD